MEYAVALEFTLMQLAEAFFELHKISYSILIDMKIIIVVPMHISEQEISLQYSFQSLPDTIHHRSIFSVNTT
jgi:hypothetical protein